MKLTEDWLERLAGAAIDEGLADAAYAEVSSPLGRLLVVETPRGVCRIAFEEESRDAVLHAVARRTGARVVSSRRATAGVRSALEAYFGGALQLEVPVDLCLVASPWFKTVLRELRRVGPGEVTTYGRLAASSGRPRAARATGTALARNPVPLVIPCHRVLPSTGAVGNYGGGAWRKRWLLGMEGALPPAA